jgi:hypothetical protein
LRHPVFSNGGKIKRHKKVLLDHFLKVGGQGSSNLKEALKAMRLILLLSALE